MKHNHRSEARSLADSFHATSAETSRGEAAEYPSKMLSQLVISDKILRYKDCINMTYDDSYRAVRASGESTVVVQDRASSYDSLECSLIHYACESQGFHGPQSPLWHSRPTM